MTNKNLIAVVTGANKGIGKAIVKHLSLKFDTNIGKNLKIYLTSRNSDLGKKALEELLQETKNCKNVTIEYFNLDISNTESIKNLVSSLKENKVDILINNAGIAFKGDAFDEKIIRETMDINFFGTLNTIEHFIPIMNSNGRIINVSSRAGLTKIVKGEIHKRFTDPNLTIEELKKLMLEFPEDVKEGNFLEKGWPKQAYGISKLGLSILTLLLSKKHENLVLIRALCPGYVDTDMTSHKGHLTVDQGAETPVYLAFSPLDDIKSKKGHLWAEKKVIDF